MFQPQNKKFMMILNVIETVYSYYLLLYLILIPGFSLYSAVKLVHTRVVSNRYLAALLITLNIYCVLMAISLEPQHVQWKDHLLTLIGYLLTPLEYLFIVGFLTNDRIKPTKPLLHFIAFIVVIAFLSILMAVTFYKPSMSVFSQKSSVLFILKSLLLVQCLLYMFLIIRFTAKCKRLKEKYDAGDLFRFSTANKLIFLNIICLIFGVITVLVSIEYYFFIILALTVLVLVIVSGMIRKPNVFFDVKRTLDTIKYRNTKLDDSLIEEYYREISAAMSEEELFRDPGLTLNSLAKHLNITMHNVSQVINLKTKMSFTAYINKMRVDYAKVLLSDRDAKVSVIDVCYESGFNSKSSFNTVFKKITGVTPSEFRDKIL